jgi:plasmanylethanolamine desaturase
LDSRIEDGYSEQSEFPLRAYDVFFVFAGIALSIIHIVRFANTPELGTWVTALMVLLALPMADFFSGFMHWAGDTWGREDTPFFGRRFIRPFRFHHVYPMDMLKSHFFTTNGDPALVTMPFFFSAFLLPLDHWFFGPAAVFLVAFATFGLPTSQFHKWSHMKQRPKLVSWAQRRGLILSPEHHWRHHKSPHMVNYCIIAGWCDPFLQKVDFWSKAEVVISRVTGLIPREPTQPTIQRTNGPNYGGATRHGAGVTEQHSTSDNRTESSASQA